MSRPNINVTPLIDVLLVLLIIFMVISPLKPSAFQARAPAEPKIDGPEKPNPLMLGVAIEPDASLRLNNEGNVGTVCERGEVIEKLRATFAERLKNRACSERAAGDGNPAENEKVEKTVFIKAPRGRSYGDVARVIDAVKQSGASPIGLQIDDLQQR